MSVKFKTIYIRNFDSINAHVGWIVNNRVNKHNFRLYPAKLVHFDFSGCKFPKPYHIAPLACLIYEYQEKGFTIKLVNIPGAINEYFNAFNFNQFCRKEEYNNFPTPSDPAILPLWRIEQTASNIYPVHAKEYFEQLHFADKSLFALGNSLAELMNNIFDHSGSLIPGYTFTHLSKNNIITCVCDFGIGIPKKVNNYLKVSNKECLDNISALKKALELKFSTLSMPHNRGFGWDNIVSVVTALKGRMVIISNNVIYRLYSNSPAKAFLMENNFPGTSIVIFLNTDSLPVKEKEITDELTIL